MEQIKKGDEFYCIEDVYMIQGNKRYCKGVVYRSEKDSCITDMIGNKKHYWSIDDEFKTFFEKIEEETDKIGQKHDSDKLPYFTVLFRQFPNALREVVKCSQAGHRKYSETDKDWLNFTRLKDTETRYRNAMLRHLTEEGQIEDMSEYGEMSHEGAVVWNALADLENKLLKK